MSNFERCLILVMDHEDGFTNDSRDRGNWTTGVIGPVTLAALEVADHSHVLHLQPFI